jgi:hypothetical protein
MNPIRSIICIATSLVEPAEWTLQLTIACGIFACLISHCSPVENIWQSTSQDCPSQSACGRIEALPILSLAHRSSAKLPISALFNELANCLKIKEKEAVQSLVDLADQFGR